MRSISIPSSAFRDPNLCYLKLNAIVDHREIIQARLMDLPADEINLCDIRIMGQLLIVAFK